VSFNHKDKRKDNLRFNNQNSNLRRKLSGNKKDLRENLKEGKKKNRI
jgi:hypothetical protein